MDMLLQRLVEYSSRLDMPPELYSDTAVRYIIELGSDGAPLSPEPVDTSDPSSPRTKNGLRRPMPQVQRASGIKPLLLADNGEYTLGLPKKNSTPDKVQARHSAYMRLLERCAAETGEPAVRAVLAFLSNDPVSHLRLPESFDPGATVTFRVDGVLPVDLPAVQSFWARVNDPEADPNRPPRIMQCLICGRERPVLERLQGKIKRVPGGQTSGTSIISANSDAFESYGLTASLVAPTCQECGERFTKAANSLLADRASRIDLGGAAFIFWTREKVDFSLWDLLTDPKPEQVRQLLGAGYSGKPLPEVDDTAFYCTALSGSGGRAVVRDWIDTTIGEVRRHLSTWFERQAIVGPAGEEAQPLGLYPLALSLVRESRDLAPPTPRAMLRAALTGAPLPMDLLFQAVRRNHAEQGVTRPRAAMIKLVLMSQQFTRKEDHMVQLEPNNHSPAYLCGRLLAVLEEVQRLAIPGANSTIVDRFFGTASSAPSSVFGRLIRGAQPHLAKLERDRPGAWRALQTRLEDIQSALPAFPRILTLEEQGLFALGYYHQRAWDRKAAREAAERRRSGHATAGEEGLAELEPDENA